MQVNKALRAELESSILEEHSKSRTLILSEWVGDNPERLAALMDVFLGNDYRLTQRSAWIVRYVGSNHPEMFSPWLSELVKMLRRPGIHNAVKRNIVGLFDTLEIPEELEGELADLCFGYVADPKEEIAIRAFSITVLERICKKIPELMPELLLILEENLEHTTAAFKVRAKKVLSAQKTRNIL